MKTIVYGGLLLLSGALLASAQEKETCVKNDVYIVLDKSTSIANEDETCNKETKGKDGCWGVMKDVASQLVQKSIANHKGWSLPDCRDLRVQLLTFSNIRQDAGGGYIHDDESLAAGINALGDVSVTGGTIPSEAFEHIAAVQTAEGANLEGRNQVVVFITDGKADRSRLPQKVAKTGAYKHRACSKCELDTSKPSNSIGTKAYCIKEDGEDGKCVPLSRQKVSVEKHALDAAKALREGSPATRILSLGIGGAVDADQLAAISGGKENMRLFDNFNNLQAIVNEIQGEIADVVVTDPPTEKPTKEPTEPPTDRPTRQPTQLPTRAPTDTRRPTGAPTAAPTEEESKSYWWAYVAGAVAIFGIGFAVRKNRLDSAAAQGVGAGAASSEAAAAGDAEKGDALDLDDARDAVL
jgi:hypothetical protein